jgi:LPS O-antigen subunit length determinant protein (WzzB/FepE family)
MSEMKRTTDDEIDLIELFEILWNGKLFILTVTILATIVGFAYAQFSKPVYVPKYKINVPYVNVISYGSSNK